MATCRPCQSDISQPQGDKLLLILCLHLESALQQVAWKPLVIIWWYSFPQSVIQIMISWKKIVASWAIFNQLFKLNQLIRKKIIQNGHKSSLIWFQLKHWISYFLFLLLSFPLPFFYLYSCKKKRNESCRSLILTTFWSSQSFKVSLKVEPLKIFFFLFFFHMSWPFFVDSHDLAKFKYL